MSTQKSDEDNPMNYIVLGILLAMVGTVALFLGMDEDSIFVVAIGVLIASIGAIVAQVGVIAMGVRIGVRSARE